MLQVSTYIIQAIILICEHVML